MSTETPARPAELRARRVRLAASPAAAGEARAHVRAAVRGWHVPVDLDTAVLLTSELVTNAITAAPAGHVTLAVRCAQDRLRVDVTALERQFPGLRARVLAARAAAGTPAQDGVQPLHPVSGTGCSERTNGVQLTQERGAAIAPEPYIEPSIEPPAAARAGARGTGPPAEDRTGGGASGEFFGALGPGWLLTARQQARLVPAVCDAVAAGWDPVALAAFVGANCAGVRNPYAILAARLSPGELPLRARPSRAASPGAATATRTPGSCSTSAACQPTTRGAARAAGRRRPGRTPHERVPAGKDADADAAVAGTRPRHGSGFLPRDAAALDGSRDLSPACIHGTW